MTSPLARPPTQAPATPRGAELLVAKRSRLASVLREAREASRVVDSPRMGAKLAMRLLPDFTFPGVRAQVLRLAGCDIRRGVAVLGEVYVIGPRGAMKRLRVGPDATIGPGVTFGLDDRIVIGRGVSIGPHVTLHTGSHSLGPATRRMAPSVASRPIVVEEGVWVGLAAIVFPGVRLGRGCVVSAGSVVTKDVPPNALVAGNPATVVSELPR